MGSTAGTPFLHEIPVFEDFETFFRVAALPDPVRETRFHIVRHEDLGNATAVLPPYRQGYYEISLNLADGVRFSIDGFTEHSLRNTLTFAAPYRLLSLEVAEDARRQGRGFLIFAAAEFLGGENAAAIARDFPYFDPDSDPTIRIGADEVNTLLPIFESLYAEFTRQLPFSSHVVRAQLSSLLWTCRRFYGHRSAPPATGARRLFDAFRELVLTDGGLYSVRDYADKLFVTPRHLSDSVRKVSGQGPLGIIQTHRLTAAKELLLRTPMTIAQIADKLSFSSPAHFTAFFRDRVGCPPLVFRRSAENP